MQINILVSCDHVIIILITFLLLIVFCWDQLCLVGLPSWVFFRSFEKQALIKSRCTDRKEHWLQAMLTPPEGYRRNCMGFC